MASLIFDRNDLIFDRNEDDIYNARTIINDRVKNFLSLTEEEEDTIRRGTFNSETINRILSGFVYVIERIKSIGYYGANIIEKNWENGEIYTASDFEELLKCAFDLESSFFSYNGKTSDLKKEYSFQTINKIEKIIYDADKIYEYVYDNFRECGDLYCGEE